MITKFRTGFAAFLTLAVIAAVVVLATQADGREATRATANDGGAWMVDRQTGGIAHVVFSTREPTAFAQIAAPGSALSARQAFGVTAIHDQTTSAVTLIDRANAQPQSTTLVPLGAIVRALPDSVAIYDTTSTQLWVTSTSAFGQADDVAELSPLPVDGIALWAVGIGGSVAVVDSQGQFTWPASTGTEPLVLPDGFAPSHMTMTGERAVLVDGDQWFTASPSGFREVEGLATENVLVMQRESDSWPLVMFVSEANNVVVVDLIAGTSLPLGVFNASPTALPILHDGCAHVLGGTTGDMLWSIRCLDGRGTDEQLNSADNAELRLVNGQVFIDELDGSGYTHTPELEVQEIGDFSSVFDESDGEETTDGEDVRQEIDPDDEDALEIQDDLLDDDEVNEPPVAEDDVAGTRLGRPAVLNVLENDSDPDGDVILIDEVELLSGNGRVEISNDGTTVQVTPSEGIGQIEFRYRISDGRPNSTDEARVVVDVLPQAEPGNRAPIARLDRLTGAAGTVVTVNLLDNDVDPDGDALVLRSIDTETDVSVLTVHPNGDALLALPSTVVEGVIEVPYLIEDEWRLASEGKLLVTVRLDESNVPPDARNDTGSTTVGQRILIDLLANDVDGDNDILSIGQIAKPLTVGDIGFVSTSQDGAFTFEPNAAGTFVFEYSATDRTASDLAQIRIEVRAENENRPPTALRDDVVLALGETRLVRAFDNDGDPDGDLFGVIDQSKNPNLDAVYEAGLGFFVTMKPGADSVETFTYRLSDGYAESELAMVVVARSDVAFQNSPPVAIDDVARVRAGRRSILNVLRNDFDPEGGALTVAEANANDNVTTALGALGQWVEVEVPPESELPFALLYTIVDDVGNVGAANVQVAIVPSDEPNSPPTARPDAAYTTEGLAISIPVLANDSDPQSDSLLLTDALPTAPVGGTVELLDDGTSFRYSPQPGFLGTDRFSYIVQDSEGAQSTGFVQVAIMPQRRVNTDPIANPDLDFTFSAGRGEVALDVLANDVDFDGDPLTVIELRGQGGAIAPDGNAVLVTLPASATEEEIIALTYAISDGRGGVDEAQINVTVLPNVEPVPPIAEPDVAGPVRQGDVVEVAVTDNDEDPDGLVEDLVVSSTELDVTVDGQLLVIVAPAESTEITYTITDLDGLTATSFVSLAVEPNLAPVVEDQIFLGEFFTDEPIPTIELVDYVIDPEGDELTFSNVSAQIGGTTRLNNDSRDARVVFFSPDPGFEGDAGFVFTVTDTAGNQATGRVTLKLLGKSNQPPEPIDSFITVEAGVPQPFLMASLFRDPDEDDALSYVITTDSFPPIEVDYLDKTTLTIGADITADTAVSLIQIQATDRAGEQATASLEISLLPSSIGPPVTTADSAETNQGETVTHNVLVNDVDTLGEGDLKIVDAFVDAAAGSTSFTTDSITLVPNPDFFGDAVIQYRIADARNRADGEADGLLTVFVVGRPDPPAAVEPEAVGPREVNLTWQVPANNGAPIDGYRIRVSSDRSGSQSELVDTGSTSPAYAFSDREPGVEYQFEVLAFNKAGDGEYSAMSSPVIPDEVPGAPSRPSNEFRDPGELFVQWSTPPNEGSDISRYMLEITGCTSALRDVGLELEYLWEGLINADRCSFRVHAENLAVQRGSDPLWSPDSPNECPVQRPATPAVPVVVRGDKEANVTWAQPENPDCEELIEYELRRIRNGSIEQTDSVPAGTLTQISAPLINGDTYTFQVRALNRQDWSDWSVPSSPVIPCGTPFAPTAPSATRGDMFATVVSTGEAGANGCAVSQYEIRISGSEIRPQPADDRITGLANGTVYWFEIRGINEIGDGDWSPVSNDVTPAGRPEGGQARSTQNGNTFGWVIDGADGNGTNITGYVLTGAISAFTSSPSQGIGDCLNTLGNPCEAENGGVEPAEMPCEQNAETRRVDGYAVNNVGNGTSLSASITLLGCPGVPSLTISNEVEAYRISFTRPSGADRIYVVRDGSVLGAVSGTSQRYTGTAGRDYSIVVWACNEFGCNRSATRTATPEYPPITFVFYENPFLCDGVSRWFGEFRGLTPGDSLLYSSTTTPIDLPNGTANSEGVGFVRWFCTAGSGAGDELTVTAGDGRQHTIYISYRYP